MRATLENLAPGTRFRVAGLQGRLVSCSGCSATVRIDGGVREVEFDNPADGTVRRFTARRVKTTTWAPATMVEPLDDLDEIEDPDATPDPGAPGSQPEEIDMATKTKTKAKGEDTSRGAAARRAAAAAREARKAAAEVKDERTGHAPQSTLDLAETKKLEKARAKQAKEAAARENARLKAERKASPDGKTASERAMAKAPKKASALDAAVQVLAQASGPMNPKAMIEAMAAAGLWTSPGGKTPHATLYSAIIREIATKGADSRFIKVDGGFAASGQREAVPA